jgi:hypothetical protein
MAADIDQPQPAIQPPASAARSTEPEPVAMRSRDYTPAVYGSLLVTTLIAVQWRYQPEVVHVGLALVISVGVFWLTHVWAGLVNRRIRGPIGRAEALAIATDESPMLLAVIVPSALLGLAPLGLTSADTAIAISLAASIVQLFLWGLAVGRAAHSRWHLAVGVAAVDALLGLSIVALKVVVIH